MKKGILIYIISLILYSCVYDPPQEKGIRFYNNSDSAIYVQYSFTDSLIISNNLTLFDNFGSKVTDHLVSPCYRLNAFSVGFLKRHGRKSLVYKSKDKKLRLFFIKEKTMRTKTWVEICSKQIYVKRMVLTLKDLERTNWNVIYP